MAINDIARLRQGVAEWNEWRSEVSGYRPNLRRARLGNTDLNGADLRGADLIGASLTDGRLTGAKLANANLIGANLERAKLRDADLTGADLSGALLTNAKLRNAILNSADLTAARLAGADLTNAIWDEATVWPDGFTPPGSASLMPPSESGDTAEVAAGSVSGLWVPRGPLHRVDSVEGPEADAAIRKAEDLIFNPRLSAQIERLPKELSDRADDTRRELQLELKDDTARDPVIILRLYARLSAQVGLFDASLPDAIAAEFGSDPEPFTDFTAILNDSLPKLGSTNADVAAHAAEAVVAQVAGISDDKVLNGRTHEEFVDSLTEPQLDRAINAAQEDPKTRAEIEQIIAETGKLNAETDLTKAKTVNEKRKIVTWMVNVCGVGGGFVLAASANTSVRGFFRLLGSLFESAI